MIRKTLSAIILIPLGLVLIALAAANRQFVDLTLDPLALISEPGFALRLPLFLLLFAMLIAGVVIGGLAAWPGRRRWRRAARHHEAEALRYKLIAEQAPPPRPLTLPAKTDMSQL